MSSCAGGELRLGSAARRNFVGLRLALLRSGDRPTDLSFIRHSSFVRSRPCAAGVVIISASDANLQSAESARDRAHCSHVANKDGPRVERDDLTSALSKRRPHQCSFDCDIEWSHHARRPTHTGTTTTKNKGGLLTEILGSALWNAYLSSSLVRQRPRRST